MGPVSFRCVLLGSVVVAALAPGLPGSGAHALHGAGGGLQDGDGGALLGADGAVQRGAGAVQDGEGVPGTGGDATLDTLFRDLEWRNIGPANMAGRVTDIEAVESDFQTVYVGTASGGVWKSTNAGTTWEPIFEEYGSSNVGDIAVSRSDPDVVWVGTGESCTRNSIGWGDGVYRSTDGGATFENMGLEETHHVSEVLIHPEDPDTVWAASQGHLWDHTGRHGIFRTRDGGETWEHLTGGLPDDGRTGASDLVMDPSDPDVLYAAMWERLRQPHRFDSGGSNGGIFKSADGGDSWEELTDGLPGGDTGKIGLAVSRSRPEVVMAIVEHGFQPEREIDGEPNPDYEDMSKLGTGIYRSEDGGASWEYVNRYNNRPFYYSHIWIDPADDMTVYVLAGSAQISVDGGRSFERRMNGISGDFHALWVNPDDPDVFYVGNDKGSYVTFDKGRTFVMFDNMDIGQFYAIDVDMRDPYWVYGGLQDNGNWGGPSNSRDWNGILNDHWFKFHSGDGFHTTVDPEDWRTVYTEAQGGRIRRLDAVFRQVGESITPDLDSILNVDEVLAECEAWEPEPEGEEQEEAGGSFGFFGGDDRLPRECFRFNWSSPLILSPHRSSTVWFGGNHLFRSVDRGGTWEIVSPDLSYNDPETIDPETGGLTRDVTGAETHATLTTISESPLRLGLVWAGTDDGRLWYTPDGGDSWVDVRPNLPGVPRGLWVSRVEASRFVEGRSYVSFDGHRSDDFRPWIFRTDDLGETWVRITDGIPDDEPVYVVREDTRNPRLLFAGTEFGVYATVDGGASWRPIMNGLPTVPVHDLVIHPRDADLIAGTHGRSVWILDDITPLQQLDDDVRASDVHLFDNRVATLWKGISRGATRGHKLFTGRNPLTIQQRPPGNSPQQLVNSAAIHYWVGEGAAGQEATLEIRQLEGERARTRQITLEPGLHRYYWDLRFDPTEEEQQRAEELRERFGDRFRRFGNSGQTAGPGSYVVSLIVAGETRQSVLRVREDPEVAGIQ